MTLKENEPVLLNIPISAPAILLDISGRVFVDANGNGVWDGTEIPLRKWSVRLSQEITTGAERAITETPEPGMDGYYAFVPEVLARQRFLPGTYVVHLNQVVKIPPQQSVFCQKIFLQNHSIDAICMPFIPQPMISPFAQFPKPRYIQNLNL